MISALRALGATILLEVPTVALFYPGQRVRMASAALIVNIVTNLTLNLVLPNIAPFREHHELIGEVLALVVEAATYTLVARPRDIARALAVSGVCNLLSYEVGPSVMLWVLKGASLARG